MLYDTGRCKICGNADKFFFKWSTSRYFRRDKVLDILKDCSRRLNKYDKHNILFGDYRVCGECCEKYGLMVR